MKQPRPLKFRVIAVDRPGINQKCLVRRNQEIFIASYKAGACGMGHRTWVIGETKIGCMSNDEWACLKKLLEVINGQGD